MEKESFYIPLMEQYLEEIVSICKKEGIELILVRVPYVNANLAEYKVLSDFAEKNEILSFC